MADIDIRADYRVLLCRLGEVWLKGRNRQSFMGRLRHNLAASLEVEIPGVKVRLPHARILVELPEGAPVERAIEICADTPGITRVSPVIPLEADPDLLEEKALALVAAEWAGKPGSFRVRTRRQDKRFPIQAPTFNSRVGGQIALAHGWPVDLKTPDRTLSIDITTRGAFLSVSGYPGVGGLPIGSAGKVLLLLSGGIDSPVAGYLAQKRGCALEALYFHSPPFIGEASKDKVLDLARALAPRQGGMLVHVAHFTDIQKAIRDADGGRFTVLLYRRFMYRIAAAFAEQRGLVALCTGENLGQVASQTIQNLRVVDVVTDALTLRPLLTADKQETIELARRIGTFDTSVLPHEDCCTLFVPDHPATKAPLTQLLRWEARVDVDALVAAALEQIETIRV